MCIQSDQAVGFKKLFLLIRVVFACAARARPVIFRQLLHCISIQLVEVVLSVATRVVMVVVRDTLQIVLRRNSHSDAFIFGMAKLMLKFFLQGFGWADLPKG